MGKISVYIRRKKSEIPHNYPYPVYMVRMDRWFDESEYSWRSPLTEHLYFSLSGQHAKDILDRYDLPIGEKKAGTFDFKTSKGQEYNDFFDAILNEYLTSWDYSPIFAYHDQTIMFWVTDRKIPSELMGHDGTSETSIYDKEDHQRLKKVHAWNKKYLAKKGIVHNPKQKIVQIEPDGSFQVLTKGKKSFFDIYLVDGKLNARLNRYGDNVLIGYTNEFGDKGEGRIIKPSQKNFFFKSGDDLTKKFKGSVIGSLKISDEVKSIMFPGIETDKNSKKMSKPQKIKIGDQEFDCDDLVAEERERLAKKRASAKKSAKKPESKKNTKRLDKTTDTIKENIKDRIDDGKKPSKREIVALISKTRDLKAKLVKLKEQL